MLARREFIGTAGALLLVPSVCIAEALSVSPAGLIFVDVEIGGRRAKALIDTGSIRGFQITDSLAKALGLTLQGTGQRTQRYQGAPREFQRGISPQLAIAGATFKSVETWVSPGDIEAIATQIGEAFDAIVGWPFLSKQAFVVDYPAKELRFGQLSAAGLSLPLVPQKPLPVVEGTLAAHTTSFLVDTGAPWCNIDVSLAGSNAVGSRVELPFEVAGRHFSATFRVKDLSAMTRGVGAQAVIGHRFLSQFRLAWSPKNLSMSLA